MNATTRTARAIAIAAVSLLLLLFGSGMMTGTMMSGGMGSGTVGGIDWMWVPASFAVVVLGVVHFSTIFGKKK